MTRTELDFVYLLIWMQEGASTAFGIHPAAVTADSTATARPTAPECMSLASLLVTDTAKAAPFGCCCSLSSEVQAQPEASAKTQCKLRRSSTAVH